MSENSVTRPRRTSTGDRPPADPAATRRDHWGVADRPVITRPRLRRRDRGLEG
ncbi:hypothetical protein [Pseudonocardia dioxanivorans]|uniref:hypothetical protein n=1 Tax=Pseudonocardia dioxanivorans TaxID=240495 RepID=UPI00131A4F6B|nr:hypothetical protein [Pseudonocardia dioxanivorans]